MWLLLPIFPNFSNIAMCCSLLELDFMILAPVRYHIFGTDTKTTIVTQMISYKLFLPNKQNEVKLQLNQC